MASISAERANFLLIFSFTLSGRILTKLALSKLANRTVFSSDLIAVCSASKDASHVLGKHHRQTSNTTTLSMGTLLAKQYVWSYQLLGADKRGGHFTKYRSAMNCRKLYLRRGMYDTGQMAKIIKYQAQRTFLAHFRFNKIKTREGLISNISNIITNVITLNYLRRFYLEGLVDLKWLVGLPKGTTILMNLLKIKLNPLRVVYKLYKLVI